MKSQHNTVVSIEQKLHQHLKNLQSDLGDVSRRCVSFFEEKPSSSSVPMLRSELNLAVEKSERLNSLSSVYLHKSVRTPTHPCFSYTPTLSVLSLSYCSFQVENGRCADEKLTGCWESGEEVWRTVEWGGYSSCRYHCHPGLERADKGELLHHIQALTCSLYRGLSVSDGIFHSTAHCSVCQPQKITLGTFRQQIGAQHGLYLLLEMFSSVKAN